ncbi:flavodoxin domain-containing protein [Simiduia sp. 21SJ11W-1]|uniref:flavodoxin domain-containing protein n=1 Tax=Simiduia sp. 21SJ11W-1 TaxID=2909669 RepID=UPI0020A10375|nr:flavodoxin domain-containing protein [Simiduia sp. 21SJ11W-1]UTA46591.1 flavodoxin domain-containing protein [Simiduia sp. 21SJ11W-1]
MAKVIVFVGTVMGTAEGVGLAMAKQLESEGHKARVEMSPRAQDLLENKDALWIFCTSNTGAGDLPDNIQDFYVQLTQEFPAIAGQHYRMVILGDSCYPTFAEAGHRLDAALADIGAVRDGEPLVLDAMTGEDPQEQALTWLKGWAETL